MTHQNLKETIVEKLKVYPQLTTIMELVKDLGVAYYTIYRNLMELIGERKVGYIKKGGIKFFFAPYNPAIDLEGRPIPTLQDASK